MANVGKYVLKWLEHPVAKLVMGLILFASGLNEVYEELSKDLENASVGAHHGVMFFGFFYAISALPHMVEGLSSSIEGVESIKGKKSRE